MERYKLYVGCEVDKIVVQPCKPFDENVINFLSEVSKSLMRNRSARLFSDVIGFAFWCRRVNLLQEFRKIELYEHTIGRGLAIHIAPSNVPVNFAFSFAFGLLFWKFKYCEGPGSNFIQKEIILETFKTIMEKETYQPLHTKNSLIYYERDDQFNEELSKISDCRLIWGGDQTVKYFKNLPTKARNIDVCFADRYSLSIIGAKEVLSLSIDEINMLCNNFYNDAFFYLNKWPAPHPI